MKLKTFRLIKAIPTSINLAVAAQIQDAKTENIHEGNENWSTCTFLLDKQRQKHSICNQDNCNSKFAKLWNMESHKVQYFICTCNYVFVICKCITQ